MTLTFLMNERPHDLAGLSLKNDKWLSNWWGPLLPFVFESACISGQESAGVLAEQALKDAEKSHKDRELLLARFAAHAACAINTGDEFAIKD